MFQLIEQGPLDFAAHGEIPVAFTASSRLDIDRLQASDGQNFAEIPTQSYEKDYDAFGEERPGNLGNRFDLTNWVLIAAFEDSNRVGGAIVAGPGSGYNLAEERSDVAVLVDIRVAPKFRKLGIGRQLMKAVSRWAIGKGCSNLMIETQDTNVAANRFYRSMGCSLHSVEPNAYGATSDEARIVWALNLRKT